MPRHERRLDPVREAACLAHVVPGVSLRLPLANGEHLLVSHVCLGADLDPCQLRVALIADRAHGLAVLTDLIVGAEVASGLVYLGGGLYQRVHAGTAERWFTTTLPPHAVADTLLREVRCHGTTDSCEVVVKPDEPLGLSAVCVRGVDDRAAPTLDDTALRALAACLVAELASELDGARR